MTDSTDATTDGTTVVLGWDALDYELLQQFGLEGAFGTHTKPIETYRNEHIGEPHTRELWPTMITGVGPDDHGIWAAEPGEGVKWSNPVIRTAARIAQYTVPENVKTVLGRWLRSQGAGVEKYDHTYYDDQDLSTVFDDRRARPIAVPNYWTPLDEKHGFMFDRGAQLGKWLDRDSEGWRPADEAQQASVEQTMWAEAGQKLALVEQAMQREYDLVFAWFGIVDTCGHVEPAAATPVQRRAYEQAASWTNRIGSQLRADDRLVCVSDHGLRDGHHTMDATLATDCEPVADRVESVFDVWAALDAVTPSRESVDIPAVRQPLVTDTDGADASADEIHERLESLGYV